MRLPIILLSIILLIRSTYTHDNDEEIKCAHNKFHDVPDLLDVEEEFLPGKSRVLQTITYPNLRVTVDYYNLVNGTDEFKSYVQNDLVPPVLDYFQAALAIKQPLTSTLKLSTTTKTLCSSPVPPALYTGVATDFFLIVSSTEDTENWVASAGPCMLSSTTKRPIVARMLFNMVYTKAASGDVLGHEKNMYLTMHEMIHALGFSGSNFVNFIDDYGVPLQNHIKTVVLNGTNRTVLDVEPLTSKLRTHYGCATLQGAFMENEGGVGTEGSHFERRHFVYEVMTSGVIHGRRVSEFSLAVLEGSGWYMPNYTYAEPFYFGQGQGCAFLYNDCTTSSYTSQFEEFCTGTNRQCTAAGRGGGACTSDSRSDGCKYVFPVIDNDCENPLAVDNARFPNAEVFGRGLGSKCFEGNLSSLTKSTYTSYCFKYNCVGSGLTTQLEVMLGATKAVCKVEGPLKVTGYYGNLNCPDPITFCSAAGKKYCPRNCMGRGVCVSNQCQCNTGYTGIDCALNIA